MTAKNLRESGSFRDPSGTVFTSDSVLYRQINLQYKSQYDALMQNGLYNHLTTKNMMISHEECEMNFAFENGYKIIKPKAVPFISYPYEWSFEQLRDAAVLTLNIHLAALEKGMILKDASAYNVQFICGSPIFIDTLSFDFYKENSPWIAYGQFCRHFLAPLLLMAYTDINLNKLLITYIDGIPIELADKLLKGGGMFAKQHISWQAKAISKHDSDATDKKEIKQVKLSLFQHKSLIESLIRGIEAIKPTFDVTEWGDYYSRTNYSDTAAQSKESLVREFLETVKPEKVWDIGANDGTYSLIAEKSGAEVVAFDVDPIATQKNYLRVKKEKLNMLPLLHDFTNPAPAIGFANNERKTIEQRQRADVIMLLAVIHHMAISNNLPLDMIAEYFASICNYLIVEFVPKEDSQVKVLLATRDDIFDNYDLESFENIFGNYFDVVKKEVIESSIRTLYLLKTKK